LREDAPEKKEKKGRKLSLSKKREGEKDSPKKSRVVSGGGGRQIGKRLLAL